jgi:hypothetical protein
MGEVIQLPKRAADGPAIYGPEELSRVLLASLISEWREYEQAHREMGGLIAAIATHFSVELEPA